MKILVTSFEPFNHETINPSYEIMKRLDDEIDNVQIIKACLPVVFDQAVECVALIIEKERPDCVLSIGQAGGRKAITVEKIAINYKDADITDNMGQQPHNQKIKENGLLAYPSLLPCETIVEKIKEANIPVALSYSAGTFVCNNLMYGVLDLIKEKYPKMISGFIHVPFATNQALDINTFRMDINQMIQAIKIALNVIIDNIQ